MTTTLLGGPYAGMIIECNEPRVFFKKPGCPPANYDYDARIGQYVYDAPPMLPRTSPGAASKLPSEMAAEIGDKPRRAIDLAPAIPCLHDWGEWSFQFKSNNRTYHKRACAKCQLTQEKAQ